MLFTCPHCHTVYDAPVSFPGPKKLRCAKCNSVWEAWENMTDGSSSEPFGEITDAGELPEINLDLERPVFTHETEEETADESIPFPEFQEIFVPPEKKFSAGGLIRPLYFIGIFCVIVSIYLFFFHPSGKIPVTVQTLNYEFVEEDFKTFLVLEAVVFNKSDKEIVLKNLTVRFLDGKGRELTSTEVLSPVNAVAPESSEKISLKIERPPSQAAKAVIVFEQNK